MGATTKREPVRNSIPAAQKDYYENILGFKGIQISDNPFNTENGSCADCENVYVDKEWSLTTRPRVDILIDFTKDNALQDIIDIYNLVNGYLIQTETSFYRVWNITSSGYEKAVITIASDVDYPTNNVNLFEQNDVIYMFTDTDYLCINIAVGAEDYHVLKKVATYIPTIKTGATVEQNNIENKDYASLNLLTDSYKIDYIWDGASPLVRSDVQDSKFQKQDFSIKDPDYYHVFSDGNVILDPAYDITISNGNTIPDAVGFSDKVNVWIDNGTTGSDVREYQTENIVDESYNYSFQYSYTDSGISKTAVVYFTYPKKTTDSLDNIIYVIDYNIYYDDEDHIGSSSTTMFTNNTWRGSFVGLPQRADTSLYDNIYFDNIKQPNKTITFHASDNDEVLFFKLRTSTTYLPDIYLRNGISVGYFYTDDDSLYANIRGVVYLFSDSNVLGGRFGYDIETTPLWLIKSGAGYYKYVDGEYIRIDSIPINELTPYTWAYSNKIGIRHTTGSETTNGTTINYDYFTIKTITSDDQITTKTVKYPYTTTGFNGYDISSDGKSVWYRRGSTAYSIFYIQNDDNDDCVYRYTGDFAPWQNKLVYNNGSYYVLKFENSSSLKLYKLLLSVDNNTEGTATPTLVKTIITSPDAYLYTFQWCIDNYIVFTDAESNDKLLFSDITNTTADSYNLYTLPIKYEVSVKKTEDNRTLYYMSDSNELVVVPNAFSLLASNTLFLDNYYIMPNMENCSYVWYEPFIKAPFVAGVQYKNNEPFFTMKHLDFTKGYTNTYTVTAKDGEIYSKLKERRELLFKSKLTTRFYNQRWTASGSYIFYTSNNDPTYFPMTNFDTLGDTGYDVTGFNLISDTGMVAYTKDQLSIITPAKDRGDGNYDYAFTETKNTSGNIAPKGTIVTSYSVMPLQIDKKGVFTIQQTENVVSEANVVTPITDAIQRKWLKEFDPIGKNYTPDITQTLSVNDLYWTYLYVPAGDITHMYVLDNRTGAWFYWEIPIKVINVFNKNEKVNMVSDDGVIYTFETTDIQNIDYSSADQSYVMRLYYDKTKTDKYLIDWHWYSQIIPLGSINHLKQLIDTTFILDDDEDTDNYGLSYKFRCFRKNIYDSDPRDIEGDIQYVRSRTVRSLFTRINFLQLQLKNRSDDEMGDYSRLRLVGLGFRYRILGANRP